MSDCIPFIAHFVYIHQSGVLTVLFGCYMVPRETAAVSAHVLCSPYNSLQCHAIQSHKNRVHVCLAVTCHLHFWQNDRELLRATAVTWGGTDIVMSQHRKLTLEKKKKKKKISRRSFGDSNPGSFDHESGALTTELCPLPDDVTL